MKGAVADTVAAPGAQVFFCKYNDPIYVKLEKLDIMITLASERNIDQVLLELREYATEVDVDFVRKVGGALVALWVYPWASADRPAVTLRWPHSGLLLYAGARDLKRNCCCCQLLLEHVSTGVSGPHHASWTSVLCMYVCL